MSNTPSRAKFGLAALACLAVSSLGMSSASAHHGGGTFDPNKCYVFKGSVRQLAWSNPHSWIYVEVPRPDGTKVLWGFEFGTVAGLARAGFRPSDFPAGTKVTVTAHVNRNPARHTGSSSKLVLANGLTIGGAEALGSVPGAPGAYGNRKPVACPAY